MPPRPRRKALISALLYIALAGAGMAWMLRVDGRAYADPDLALSYWWVEILLLALCALVVRKRFSWPEVGFAAIVWRETLWLVPLGLILLVNLAATASALWNSPDTREAWPLLVLTFGLAALVGFNEETMFRGILLQAFMANGTRLGWAVLISAAGFCLLHSVNILGGSPAPMVAIQLGITFLFGLCFAFLALRIGSLWPLILFHALWDFSLIAAAIVRAPLSNLMIAYLPVLVLMTSALFLTAKRKRPEPSGPGRADI